MSYKSKYTGEEVEELLDIVKEGGASGYSALIHLESQMYNTISLGATGNFIDFTFEVINKTGMPTGEPVICTYTFQKGSKTQSVVEQYPAGKRVHYNIDKYISAGTNDIMVTIQGVNTKATVSTSITYQVVELSLTCNYDLSQVYNLANEAQTLESEFTVKGYGTKKLEWYIDGEQLPFDAATDEVLTESAKRRKYINLHDLQEGVHSLQVRTNTTVDGEVFYSDTEYREFMVHNGVSSAPLAAIAMTVPASYGIITTKRMYSLQKYVSYNLHFGTYNPNGSTVEAVVKLAGVQQGSLISENGTPNEITIFPTTAGEGSLDIVMGDTTHLTPVTIAQSAIAVEEITNDLQLDFRAQGRSNNATDKDQWSFGPYKGTFTGFNWNTTSGWSNDALHISAGASFDINLSPLAVDPSEDGKTIEIEFASTNVNDDNAVLCDLRNNDGTGILITATNVKLVSQAGEVIETSYKDNEFIRVAFVINKAARTTNKCMSFIYVNGIVSRGVAWSASDKYTSETPLRFVGSEDAELILKSVRIYNTALTNDEVLNNYIIYRATMQEMFDVYERNDVYEDNGSTFSYEKMMSRLPVMIVTGDVPTLEATSDKDTQITVDIEYYNLQDRERSFKMKNAAMRPQGTSSMGYPKKNFRIYTEKRDDTVLYDADGKEVKNKLYSFTKDAQPVNCWCLKADYAESSGTHNTGVARLWNKVLVDTKIENEYVLRTQAQNAALEAQYKFDVRTTIDGFPILIFYRLTPNDPLVFIGKYNFNNDKSTESVFGFTGIPNFDNSRMQCWEVLNNGNALALFTSVSNFDTKWKEAFESRYPDTKEPNTADLKAFCTWMTNVSAEDFATQKWEHLDVYKVAAYYIYLMRFGAVDQTVKNSMLTSEDGAKFYFINYDNDTINGLINTGHLVAPWNTTRITLGADGEPYYAGKDSRLWNMLEADAEFMAIVRQVDEALYVGGLRYDNVIKMFDQEQAGKWVERVYNQDAQYKYIGPYAEKGINNLFMLQGNRSQHRKFWLAKRFSLFDSKYVSGAYKSQAIEIKCIDNTPAGQQFTITAGTDIDYGYGINNVARSSNISLLEDQTHTFVTEETINRGDPLRIYGAPNIKGLDLSAMADRLAVVTIANAYNNELGTKLKSLVIGGADVNNVEVAEISGLKQMARLTHLDVQGFKNMKSLDLTSQAAFENLKAIGSSIAFVSFAKGAPVNHIELPATMKAITLEQLPYLSPENIVLEDITGVNTFDIKGCPMLSNDIEFVKNWYNNKTTEDARCTLKMDNVLWEGVSVDDLLMVANIGTLELKGKAVLTEEITLEQVEALSAAYGDSVFDKKSPFFIDAPTAIFISGRTSLIAGDTEQYKAIVFGAEVQSITWTIKSGGTNATLTTDGLLQVSENYGSGTVVLNVTIMSDKGIQLMSVNVNVKALVYPTADNTFINGSGSIDEEFMTYTLGFKNEVTAPSVASWSLEGFDGYVEIYSQDATTCVLRKVQDTISKITGNLTCSVSKTTGEVLFSVSKELYMQHPDIAETDPEVCRVLHEKGLCANATFITKDEAAKITDNKISGIFTYNDNIKSFDGFKYFTSITKLPDECFTTCKSLSSITLPAGITSIGAACFYYCTSLSSITLPAGITSIGAGCFNNCPSLSSITLPAGITSIPNYCFQGCTSLSSITLPAGITSIHDYCFYGCTSLSSITLPAGVTSIGLECFNKCKSLSLIKILSDSAPTLGNNVFGSNSSTYTGRNTSTQGINKLYVPAGATGYDTGQWLDPLCDATKCGFTLSATL